MDPRQLLQLVDGAAEQHLEPGAVIIRLGQGDAGLFVLVEGTLEVRRDRTVLARMSEPGSVVGELSMLLGTSASADVVATEPTTVRRVDNAEQLFRDVPEFGRHLAVMLARRLHRVTTYLGDLNEQFADRPGTLGLVPTVLQELLSAEQADADPGSEREPDSPY
jgi:CRP/FNR family transcriptional regulator, cyclic AMP receptor protein